MWVRSPAGWPATSRSSPITPPASAASRMRRTSCPVDGKSMAAASIRPTLPRLLVREWPEGSRWRAKNRSASCLLERRPRQQELLLADAGEADGRLGLVAGAPDVEHHALAPLAVDDFVPRPDPEVFGTGGLGRRAATAA